MPDGRPWMSLRSILATGLQSGPSEANAGAALHIDTAAPDFAAAQSGLPALGL